MRLSLLAALIAAVSVIGMAAGAHEESMHGMVIKHPWVRETPKGGTVTAAYGKFTNESKEPDRLIGATLEGVEGELHETVVEDGVSKMRRITGGIAIAPGETVELAPGGKHIMFLGLKHGLSADGYVDGELTFEKAGKMPMEFFVEALSKPAETDEDGAHKH